MAGGVAGQRRFRLQHGFEEDAVHVRPRDLQQVVLCPVDHLCGLFYRHVLGHPQAAPQGDHEATLALRNQAYLAGRVEESGLLAIGEGVLQVLDQGIRGGAAAQQGGEVIQSEADHLQRVEAADLLGEAGHKLLTGQLHHHHVVALEGGEDIRVCLQAGQQILGHVAVAAAGLAHLLDGVGGVRGVRRLQGSSVSLELALFGLLLLRGVHGIDAACLEVVQPGDQLVRRQLQCVGARHPRDEAQPVLAVLDEGIFRQVIAGRELLAQVGVAHSDIQGGSRRSTGGGTHRHAPADQCAEHREEAAVRVLDRRGVIALFVHVCEAVE